MVCNRGDSCTLHSVHPTVKDEGEMHVKCFFFLSIWKEQIILENFKYKL